MFISMNLISYLIPMIGNFSIQYNFQSLSVAMLLLDSTVCTSNDDNCRNGHQALWVGPVVKGIIFLGCMIGQLTMGYAGDVLGISEAMTLTMLISIIGALGSALLTLGEPTEVFVLMAVCRLVLGIGIGGIYPLSAVKAAQNANMVEEPEIDMTKAKFDGDVKERPLIAVKSKQEQKLEETASIAKAFMWQIPGAMFPWFIAWMFSFSDAAAIIKWKFVLGFGAVPVAIAFGLSLIELKESREKAKKQDPAVREEEKLQLKKKRIANGKAVMAAFKSPVYRRKMYGTGAAWFCGDLAFYGVILSAGLIINDIKTSDDDNISQNDSIRFITEHQLIALSLGIPAVFCTLYMMLNLSTKWTQIYAFAAQTVLIGVFAIIYVPLIDQGELLYGILCFLEFILLGWVSVTTYVLPAEYYPEETRSTFVGLSSACGKCGAMVGASGFTLLINVLGVPAGLVFAAVLSALGGWLTFNFLENIDSTTIISDGDTGDYIPPSNSFGAQDRTEIMMGGINSNAQNKTKPKQHTIDISSPMH